MNEASAFEMRPAVETDVPLLLSLIRELAEYEKLTHELAVTEPKLRRSLFGEQRVADAVLGCCGGEAVGYAVFHPTFSTFAGDPGIYLEDIYVRRAYRGKGYGRALLRYVARIARQRGCRAIAWLVLDWNAPAITFYQGLGATAAPAEWLAYNLSGAALEALANEAQR
jgi:GNAT superfamily N-acetyltransferase